MKDQESREFWTDAFAIRGRRAPQVLLRVSAFTAYALIAELLRQPRDQDRMDPLVFHQVNRD